MLVLLGVDYAAESAWRIPFIPRTIGEWLHSSLPLGTGAWAVVCVLIGGGLGGIYEWLRPIAPGQGNGLLERGLPLVIGLVLFVASLPPTLAAVQGASSTVATIDIIGWLLLCVFWGLAVDQTAWAVASRPINPLDTDSPVISRRDFLLQTVTGALLIVLLSFPIARLIDGKQLLPNLPLPFSTPPTNVTPIPPGAYF